MGLSLEEKVSKRDPNTKYHVLVKTKEPNEEKKTPRLCFPKEVSHKRDAKYCLEEPE